MNEINYSILLIILSGLFFSCTKDTEPIQQHTERYLVSVATRSTESEADYKHTVLLYRNYRQESDVSFIETEQALNTSMLPPFSLINGHYTLATLAYSSENNLTLSPNIAKGSPLATHITVGTGAVPDILFSTKYFTVSQTATIEMDFHRIVGRIYVILSNVPATPSIQSVTLTVGELTDCFALNGSYSASNNLPQGTQRTIPLTLKSGTTDTYTNSEQGTILMPSLSSTVARPLNLTIPHTDKTSISKNITPPTSGIGTWVEGGIICAPNLILSLTESPTTLQWSYLTTPVAVGGNSTDRSINYANFSTYADQNPTMRWERHPVFQYIKGIRTIDDSEWYLPSKEEWQTVAVNLSIINAALAANEKTIVSSTDNYWTSTENGASNAYCIEPNSKTILSTSKDQTYRTRAVKKML